MFQKSFMTGMSPTNPAQAGKIPLDPPFSKGEVTPPFRKGRRRRPEPQYSHKRGSGTLAPDGGEGFNKGIFYVIIVKKVRLPSCS